MKVAYKIALPLVVVITILIWFVTDTFNTTQLKVVKDSQKESALKIKYQFEKNKMQTLMSLEKNVQVTASLVADISVDNVWNYTHENLEKPLSKYLELDFMKAIEIYDSSDDKKPKVIVGKVQDHLNMLEKDIIHQDGNVIGYAKIYYDDKYIADYFQKSKQSLLEEIKEGNIKQDQFIDNILTQRTYVNFSITIVVLVLLLTTIYIVILKPLEKLEKGLNSFFNYLQHKSDSVEKIELKTDDEFGKMGETLNANIAVTTKLHEEIYQLNVNLEEKIEKRTQQLKEKTDQIAQLLDNAEEGFLSFGEELFVDSEYSKECENIFHKSIASESIADLLFQKECEDKELFVKVMGDIFSTKIKPKRKQVLLHLLPKELLVNENYIKVEYKIISAEKLMLILVDITEKKKLEQKIEKEKQTLKMVVNVVSDIREFKEIIEEFKDFCNQKKQYINDEKTYLNSMVEYYRAIHTFKGNFAQKDLLYIVPKLHEYESKINTLLKDPNRSFDEFRQLLNENNLIEWIDDDIEVIESILDQDILEDNHIISVPETLIDKMESDIKQILTFPKDKRDVTYEDLFNDVSNMRKSTLLEFFKSYPKYVEKLSNKLEKKLYPLKIVGGEDIYVSDAIHPFIKTLVHIFRNSLDHGIESLEERINSSKDEKATISCNITKVDESIVISIIDDGKGINIDSIKQKAIQKELYTEQEIANMSRQNILMIIFSDTFSTKDVVTQLSGRGVGLGAVKGEIEKLDGKIEIDTTIEKGTSFKFTVPLKNIV